MQALILDDEQKAIDNLYVLLQEYCPEIKSILTTQKPSEFIKLITEHKFDLIFLDVELPEINGLELIEKSRNSGAQVILISSHTHYALDGYDYDIAYFLPKPISKIKLLKALKHVSEEQSSTIDLIDDKIGVYDGKDYVFLNKSDIIRIKAEGNYSHIILNSMPPFLITQAIGTISQNLEEEQFMRCHRSHIINKNYIHKYAKSYGGSLILKNGDVIPLSRNAKKIIESSMV